MQAQEILIEFNADGAARISYPSPYDPLFPRRSIVIPAELAELIIDPPAMRARGISVTVQNVPDVHETRQRQHAEQMQRAGDRSNDAFMNAGRR